MNIIEEIKSTTTQKQIGTYLLTGSIAEDVTITRDEYFILFQILNHYKPSLSKEENECYLNLYSLLETCKQKGILYKYHPSTISKLILNTSLLPLILANRIKFHKIRMTGQNGYLFSCQFHSENTPSLKISDASNQYYCYGCGKSGNTIEYIKRMENLSYTNAVELIMRVFLLKKDDGTMLPEIVKKYQSSIVSDCYERLLYKGYKRILRYNVATMPHKTESIEDYYARKFQMIKRIKNKEIDDNFQCYNGDNFIQLSAKTINENLQKIKTLNQPGNTNLPF